FVLFCFVSFFSFFFFFFFFFLTYFFFFFFFFFFFSFLFFFYFFFIFGNGSVRDIMVTVYNSLNEPQMRFIMRSTLMGLVYLHAVNVFHRDVKGVLFVYIYFLFFCLFVCLFSLSAVFLFFSLSLSLSRVFCGLYSS